MKKRDKYFINLIAIVLFHGIRDMIDIYLGFYIGLDDIVLFALVAALIIQTIKYKCPQCKRNQIIESTRHSSLPKSTCYHCGADIEEPKRQIMN